MSSAKTKERITVPLTIDATILVDQVNVVGGSQTLDGHLLKLVDNILERSAGSKGAVGGNDIWIVAVGSINDSLVVKLVDLGIEGNGSSLLELDVVLDGGARVEEVGDHGSVGHPIRDSRREIVGAGGLSILDTCAKTSRSVGGALSILAVLLTILRALLGALPGQSPISLSRVRNRVSGDVLLSLLLLRRLLACSRRPIITITTLLLGQRSSISCGGKKRGDENVLHVESCSDLPKRIELEKGD